MDVTVAEKWRYAAQTWTSLPFPYQHQRTYNAHTTLRVRDQASDESRTERCCSHQLSIVNCIACYNDEKLHTLNMKPSHDRTTSLSCWHPAQMTMEQPASSNIHPMLLPWLRDWFHGVDAKDDVKAFVIHAAKSCGIDLPTYSSKDGRSSCVMPLHHEHI